MESIYHLAEWLLPLLSYSYFLKDQGNLVPFKQLTRISDNQEVKEIHL